MRPVFVPLVLRLAAQRILEWLLLSLPLRLSIEVLARMLPFLLRLLWCEHLIWSSNLPLLLGWAEGRLEHVFLGGAVAEVLVVPQITQLDKQGMELLGVQSNDVREAEEDLESLYLLV